VYSSLIRAFRGAMPFQDPDWGLDFVSKGVSRAYKEQNSLSSDIQGARDAGKGDAVFRGLAAEPSTSSGINESLKFHFTLESESQSNNGLKSGEQEANVASAPEGKSGMELRRNQAGIHLEKPNIDCPNALGPVHLPKVLVEGRLEDHQEAAVAWMWARFAAGRGFILGDEAGMGKTRSMLAFLAAVYGKTGNADIDGEANWEVKTKGLGHSAVGAPHDGPPHVQGAHSSGSGWTQRGHWQPSLLIVKSSLVSVWHDEMTVDHKFPCNLNTYYFGEALLGKKKVVDESRRRCDFLENVYCARAEEYSRGSMITGVGGARNGNEYVGRSRVELVVVPLGLLNT